MIKLVRSNDYSLVDYFELDGKVYETWKCWKCNLFFRFRWSLLDNKIVIMEPIHKRISPIGHKLRLVRVGELERRENESSRD